MLATLAPWPEPPGLPGALVVQLWRVQRRALEQQCPVLPESQVSPEEQVSPAMEAFPDAEQYREA